MKKMAIGIFALVILAGGLAGTAAAQTPWGWMFLSTDATTYNCNDGGATWDSGSKLIYIIIDSPNWTSADAYNGIEFSVDYNPALFHIGSTSPQAPAPLLIGGCSAGHCSYGVGTGGQVPNNPWTAIALEFLNFGAGSNLGFSLGPSDTPSSRLQGGPGWAWFDANDPPLYIPQEGDGTVGHPGWQQGFVVLNYDQGTAPATPFPPQVFRGGTTPWPNWDAGDPCSRAKIVATEESSWGALKAGF
jgi:hypothetical protein